MRILLKKKQQFKNNFFDIYKNVKPKGNKKPRKSRNCNRKLWKINRKTRNKKIIKIEELKELETTKKWLEELEKWKINETIFNVPREMLLTHLLRHACQLIK